MPKKPATLQYILFALIAAAAIAFYIADAAFQYEYVWHGHERAAVPLYFGLSNQVDQRDRSGAEGRACTKAIGCWR